MEIWLKQNMDDLTNHSPLRKGRVREGIRDPGRIRAKGGQK